MDALNPDQENALAEIMAAYSPGDRHLLSGFAGAGKTFLMQRVAKEFLKRRKSIALTAPTHKAVAVLAQKVRQAGIEGVECQTIHSLLSLKPEAEGDRLKFVRRKHAQPVAQHVVVIDECSMIDASLMGHIRRHLPNSFVLFVGDPAQLPPVGEVESQSFGTKSRSHLNTIIRQAADNPILGAAHTIRQSQGGVADWSWIKPARAAPFGVYLPGDPARWMKQAFTSLEFDQDPDTFRYLCWTNERVREVNQRIRQWRYGDHIPHPFMPGERALVRGPIMRDGAILFATNEEAEVVEIEEGGFEYQMPSHDDTEGWMVDLPAWKILLRKDDGNEFTVHMARNERALNRVIDRIKDEASSGCKYRWGDLHEFKSSLANLQSIYALTVHNSQGSTFKNVFADVGDIRRRVSQNLLEAQQLFYVAATRPTHALMLVNAK